MFFDLHIRHLRRLLRNRCAADNVVHEIQCWSKSSITLTPLILSREEKHSSVSRGNVFTRLRMLNIFSIVRFYYQSNEEAKGEGRGEGEGGGEEERKGERGIGGRRKTRSLNNHILVERDDSKLR